MLLPSESHVLMSSRSTAARSIPLMPMAAELWGPKSALESPLPLGQGWGGDSAGQEGARGSLGDSN